MGEANAVFGFQIVTCKQTHQTELISRNRKAGHEHVYKRYIMNFYYGQASDDIFVQCHSK